MRGPATTEGGVEASAGGIECVGEAQRPRTCHLFLKVQSKTTRESRGKAFDRRMKAVNILRLSRAALCGNIALIHDRPYAQEVW